MKEFIKSNRKTIINTLIIVVFFLPVIINLYLILLGSTISRSQVMALVSLFGVGSLLLGAYQVTEL